MSYSGKSGYSFEERNLRSIQYKAQPIEEKFTQQKAQEIHPLMDPRKALVREARDSEQFPESVPVIYGQDVTGSMEFIPDHMINEGLPHLISLLHEKGVTDAAVMFMGLGDSKANDKAPFQVGQFESGDEAMDLWVTRTWIEKKGGGNKGESYGWAWFFAANRCVTDAWDKRKQKGFIFTVGDDNCHGITSREFQEILGINHEDVSAEDLYKMASEKWNVYHFNVLGDNFRRAGVTGNSFDYMGENLIQIKEHKQIPNMMAQIIASHTKPIKSSPVVNSSHEPTSPGTKVTL